jgi:hypothetical protein
MPLFPQERLAQSQGFFKSLDFYQVTKLRNIRWNVHFSMTNTPRDPKEKTVCKFWQFFLAMLTGSIS